MHEKRLILCLHDVSPRDFNRILEIDRFYEDVGAGANYAMLLVPNFWNEWPVEKHREFISWLRERASAGVEMFLHGFYHRDTTPPEQRSLGVKIAHAVAGEGEFAAIEEAEAYKRIAAGKALFEGVLERPIDSFVAPAWQYSAGAKAALSKLGFKIAENRMTVWSPASGAVLTKSPVVAYASRDRARCASSLIWSQLSTRMLRGCDVVRHAIHPNDFNSQSLRREIRRSLGDLMTNRKIVPYRQLLEAPAL
jgi:predicted deacetylase